MKVEIDISKSVEDNAAMYYEKSKKAKRKIEGLKRATQETEKKIASIGVKKELSKQPRAQQKKREKKWFEKFRWFYTSENFLCIGGKDATTNDIIIKKYAEENDKVFHTEQPGSPFFILKADGKELSKHSMEEVAIATASFSKSWTQGFSTAEVYGINSDQVKKELGLPKGSFMIYGKRNYFTVVLRLAVGIYEDMPMCGPEPAVKKHCQKYAIITQGNLQKSDVAYKLKSILKYEYDINDIISVLPPGTCSIDKNL